MSVLRLALISSLVLRCSLRCKHVVCLLTQGFSSHVKMCVRSAFPFPLLNWTNPIVLQLRSRGLTLALPFLSRNSGPSFTAREVGETRTDQGRSPGLLPGMVKQKVAPFPCPSDSTQILPPCTSMMRLVRASPMPVPSLFGSSFSNSSKILAW